jgi:hypothetical protein
MARRLTGLGEPRSCALIQAWRRRGPVTGDVGSGRSRTGIIATMFPVAHVERKIKAKGSHVPMTLVNIVKLWRMMA